MIFLIKDNFLYQDGKQVTYKESPNHGDTIVPRWLIQHYTADINKGQAVSWLINKESKASAHIVLERDGSLTQLVKFNKRAQHAGLSSWAGIEGLNDFSIGIEIVNAGRLTCKKVNQENKYYFKTTEIPKQQVVYLKHKNEDNFSYWQTYTDKQIEVLKELDKLLVDFYNLDDILGHDDISPNRKSDPGPAFPMLDIKGILAGANKGIQLITTSNINFRVGASINDKVMEVIPKGSAVIQLLKQGDWSRISWKEKLGWVNNKYLKEY